MPHIRDLAAIFRRSQPKVKTRGNMRVINLCSWTGVADGIKDPHYPADVASVKVKEHAEKVANGLAVFGKENIKPELLPHFEGLQPLVAYLTGVVESLVHREAFEMVANITKTNRKLQPHVIPSLGSSRPRFLRAQTTGTSSSTWTARIRLSGSTSVLWWMRKTRNRPWYGQHCTYQIEMW
ncbi:hypothetical protein BDR26DRAFT_470086 [Obelidium mucronatum]|nr:hypothetical protein BDR26DRAFT_470086 [Obelidium mucronatum]